MSNLDRIVRQSGVLDRLRPVDAVRQQQASQRVHDEAGRISPEAAAPFRTPIAMHWTPGETGRKRAPQAGTAVVLAAYAATPPSTGNAIVTLTLVTPLQGSTVIATCSIPNGTSFGETQMQYPVSAGAWLGATVTQSNGASGVSISLTINGGV